MSLNEGGPGSGVKYRNTVEIGLPMSKYISVGTRKGLTQNADYEQHDIPLDMITHVAQKNYVPYKVDNLMGKRDVIKSKPIDVLWVRGDGYHVVDGHHRYLAAKNLNIDTIPARVFRKSEKSMPDYVADNPEKVDDIEQATRSTQDVRYMDKMMQAAESLSKGEWDNCCITLIESGMFAGLTDEVVVHYTMGKKIELAKSLDGQLDDAGNISWDEKPNGKYVLRFHDDGRVAEIQDETGIYRDENAIKRLNYALAKRIIAA